jgi:O-antigen/teichoic acid export membrane protein
MVKSDNCALRKDHIARTMGVTASVLSGRVLVYRDSFFLVAANIANAGFGLLFWTVAARLYQPSEVGFAAAIISAVGLLAMLAALGLDYAVIRFLPQSRDPQGIINVSLTVMSGGALILALVFLAGLGLWSPALLPVRGSTALAVSLAAAVILTAASGLLAATYLSRKRAWLVPAQALVFGSVKVVAAILLAAVGLHAVGLVGAWAIGLLALAAAGLAFFLPQALDGQYRFRPTVIREVANDMAHFAFSNYVVTVLWTAPVLLLPILITNLLGPEANAYFYVASSVSSLLAMVPTAMSMSLFAHASRDATDLTQKSVEAAKVSLAVLAPAFAGILLLGDKVLLIFGRDYAQEGTRLLWVMAATTLPLTVNFLYFSVRRVQRRMAGVVAGAAWVLVVTLGLTTYLLPRVGLLGGGVAWLVAQASLAMVILVRVAVNR